MCAEKYAHSKAAVFPHRFLRYDCSMNICLFTPEELNLPLAKQDERAQHLIKILRKKVGERFHAGVIGGSSGSARITAIENDCIRYQFTADASLKPLLPLRMIIGFPRPIQLKRLLRDLSILGVSEIHLTGTEIGEKSYMQSTVIEDGSAARMLLDGAAQAGSTYVPALFVHANVPQCLAAFGMPSGDVRIALDNVNPASRLQTVLEKATGAERIYAAVGSERGWTDHERRQLEAHGFIRAGMGGRIMRTETAAVAATAIIASCLDWM